MTELKLKSKRRFSPEVRRSMILDAAAELVEIEGISQLSMEQIAKHAEISKSLIYKYFDNVQELLKKLLARELTELRRRQFAAAEAAETFEQLVRGVTKVYLQNVSIKGRLIERLQTDPGIAKSMNPRAFNHDVAVDYFASIVHKNFDIPMETARAVTDLSFGIPIYAGSYLLRNSVDKDQLEDITVAMIIGSINGIRDDFMVRKRHLKR
ncbi:MAG: TetR/AcrR family transcriptional regulator [Pseudomonadota bacterium]